MSRNQKLILLLFLVLYQLVNVTATAVVKDSWWPEQKLPAQIVHLKPTNLAERNLAQSLSGLAAKYVNAGTHNELVWTNVSGSAYNYYLTKWLQRTTVVDKGNVDIWDLVDQYKTKGIVKGYILYTGGTGNYSVNFATIYASLYDAVLVEESLEATAVSHGLTLKYDARSKNTIASYTQTWFNSIKASLNNKLIVTIATDDYRQRDMAIAYGCMVYWGVDSFYETILSWMEPNSPIVGWNEGDEGTAIDACSKYGMLTTGATIVNLPVLSSGSKQLTIARAKNVNPKLLDFSAKKHYLSYVMSDGGNMMIQATSMALSTEYRGNVDINNLPMSWASCPVNLVQMVPDAWNLFTEQSNPIPGSLTEFSGGEYPDLFASSLGINATSTQREFAGLMNKKMKMSGIKVFGYITRDLNSVAAKKAAQIFADSIEGLVGIIAIQYVPYNGGGGEVYWVTNKQGIHIPVFTAKYYLHNENSNYINMGGPVTIANAINTATSQSQETTLDWTIVHAWSYFKKDANGAISDATSTDDNALRGVTPAMWSKSLLNNVEVVSIEELLWRLRMKYYPAETVQAINNYIPEETTNNPSLPHSSSIYPQIEKNGIIHINGLTENVNIEVYSTIGQLIHKQQLSKEGYFQLVNHTDSILILKIFQHSSSYTYKLINRN